MKKIFLVMILVCAFGCSNRKGIVKKTPDGIVFDMETDGKLSYKDKEVEAEMDTRKKAGIIEAIIQMWTLKQMEGND